jgi:hypothetical protein
MRDCTLYNSHKHSNPSALKRALGPCTAKNHLFIECNDAMNHRVAVICVTCNTHHSAPIHGGRVSITRFDAAAPYLAAYKEHRGHDVRRADDPKRLRCGVTCLDCRETFLGPVLGANISKADMKQIWRITETTPHFSHSVME